MTKLNWIAWLGLLAAASGCRMTAPMFVWKPALNQSREIHSIALTPFHGPRELASKLDSAMIETQPQVGRHITLYPPKMLEEMTNIQLASYDGQPSDVAGLSAARRAGADVMLQGQVVRASVDPQPPKQGPLDVRKRPTEQITVSWTVTDVASGERLGSNTLTLDREQAERAYPDLINLPGEPVDRVVHGISRQSWVMFTPMTKQEDVLMVLPWFSLGADRIRQGNAYARQGRWDLAEEKWQDVASKYRRNKAAWHNLALSAAAHEDFELSRRRIDHAKTIFPWDRARKTERWIDERQHDYHRALGLPDRDGGWLNPDPPAPATRDEGPAVKPVGIEELPWWTAIPGTKPPGWTWGQWFSQPWIM